MSDNIQMSLFGSAVRTPHWKKCFAQYAMNKVKYEIVFAGPIQPDFELPPYVKFVHCYPDPSPAHCTAIASKVCVGELFLPVADDTVFTPYALDIIYETYKKENDYKCMVHPRYGFGPDSDVTDENTELPIPGSNYRFGYCAAYSKQFYRELGGIDRRYRGGGSDGDLQMRALSMGGRYVYAYGAYVQEDLSYVGGNALSPLRAWKRWGGQQDNEFMKYQWFPNNILQSKSTVPFEPIT